MKLTNESQYMNYFILNIIINEIIIFCNVELYFYYLMGKEFN